MHSRPFANIYRALNDVSLLQEERPSKRLKTDGPALRVCVHCRQEKKIAQFSRDPSGPDGRQTWCMACMKARLSSSRLQHGVDCIAQGILSRAIAAPVING